MDVPILDLIVLLALIVTIFTTTLTGFANYVMPITAGWFIVKPVQAVFTGNLLDYP